MHLLSQQSAYNHWIGLFSTHTDILTVLNHAISLFRGFIIGDKAQTKTLKPLLKVFEHTVLEFNVNKLYDTVLVVKHSGIPFITLGAYCNSQHCRLVECIKRAAKNTMGFRGVALSNPT